MSVEPHGAALPVGRRVRAGSVVLLMAATAACTSISTATLPSDRARGGLFFTEEDLDQPYESLGPIQATRRGVLLFGFADLAGTDLQSGVDMLVPQVQRLGGDGVINLRFQQVQYPLPTRVLFALLFFVPLPAEVNVTGEVVRLMAGPPAGG